MERPIQPNVDDFSGPCQEECPLLKMIVIQAMLEDGVIYGGERAASRFNRFLGEVREAGALVPEQCDEPSGNGEEKVCHGRHRNVEESDADLLRTYTSWNKGASFVPPSVDE